MVVFIWLTISREDGVSKGAKIQLILRLSALVSPSSFQDETTAIELPWH